MAEGAVGWISEAHPPSLLPGGCAALIPPTASNRGCCFIVTIMLRVPITLENETTTLCA